MMEIVLCYLAVINIAAVTAYGIDKERARQRRFRIPEATLLGLALAGGSLGALVGMRAFHHKTRKIKFAVGVPLILLGQTGLIYYIMNR